MPRRPHLEIRSPISIGIVPALERTRNAGSARSKPRFVRAGPGLSVRRVASGQSIIPGKTGLPARERSEPRREFWKIFLLSVRAYRLRKRFRRGRRWWFRPTDRSLSEMFHIAFFGIADISWELSSRMRPGFRPASSEVQARLQNRRPVLMVFSCTVNYARPTQNR